MFFFLYENLLYTDIFECILAKLFKISPRRKCFRTADISAAAYLIGTGNRNMSKLACYTVFTGIKPSVNIQCIADTGSDINANNIFFFCIIKVIRLNIIV